MSDLLTHITIEAAFPLTPDRNGRVFTPDAVKNALSQMRSVPICEIRDGYEQPIGVTEDIEITEETEQEISYKMGALIFPFHKLDPQTIQKLALEPEFNAETGEITAIMAVGVELDGP